MSHTVVLLLSYYLMYNHHLISRRSRAVYLSDSGVFTDEGIWRNGQLRGELIHIQHVDCHRHFGRQERFVCKSHHKDMSNVILFLHFDTAECVNPTYWQSISVTSAEMMVTVKRRTRTVYNSNKNAYTGSSLYIILF